MLVAVLVAAGAGGWWWHSSQARSPTVSAGTVSTTVVTFRPVAPTLSTPATTAAPAPSTTTVPRTRSSVTPSTTIAVGPPIKAAGSYTYQVAGGTPIVVAARNRCWIQARISANGRVLADVILQAGRTMSFTAPVWLRLGDPTNVGVMAGATALQLPVLAGNLNIVSP